jgi:hypothetical protein
MATINMSQHFDTRISFDYTSNEYFVRSLNGAASIIQHLTFDASKTYKLTIRRPANANLLEIDEVASPPAGTFEAWLDSAVAFSCYFFQDFAGAPIAGVIGIEDFRPVLSKGLRITKLDASFEAHVKFETQNDRVLCKILDATSPVSRLDTFATTSSQVFYKILS